MPYNDTGICEKCKKPVLPGEARNGATGNHWDCQPAPTVRTLQRDLDRVLRSAGRLRRVVRKL